MLSLSKHEYVDMLSLSKHEYVDIMDAFIDPLLSVRASPERCLQQGALAFLAVGEGGIPREGRGGTDLRWVVGG
jgi:hypothetical protein